jgi:FMN-dependent NADH-azoreductase
MPTLLHIDASPRGDYSISRKVSAAFADSWKKNHPEGKVIRRDLATTHLTFVDMDWIAGAYSTPDQHTAAHKKALAISDELIGELFAADHIVIGTPMYNFAIPAVVKAWIDHIVRVGKTFSVGAGGYEGLAKGRKATVIIASSGNYAEGTPYAPYNQESPYLKAIFGFIGITDVEFVLAGGTNDVVQGKVDEKTYLAPIVGEAEKLAVA